ncbi:hypothetical protein O181_024353 [Austropuccinia psidii MF-1]|uniref:Uncharacterized protein n=1 Tax=Austropuccinia psidii MF-1 TaxID=1389203 RepID=A0A9Q3CIU4_9BASI|nr:hypothetical protein [Austropuccinia psidii MF-1]
MEHGEQEVKPRIPLGKTWSRLPEDLSQRDRLQITYGNHQRLESYQAVQTPGGLQWLHTIQEPEDQWQRVTIIHNLRKFPGEEKDTREKTRPLLTNSITPTQNEHSVVTPESDLNSDEMWLKMSQYAEQTQKKFSELQESHERMKKLTASMDKIVKALQEGHAQLRKASEEPNKILSQVFEEQNH